VTVEQHTSPYRSSSSGSGGDDGGGCCCSGSGSGSSSSELTLKRNQAYKVWSNLDLSKISVSVEGRLPGNRIGIMLFLLL